jgi:hypothetical protein
MEDKAREVREIVTITTYTCDKCGNGEAIYHDKHSYLTFTDMLGTKYPHVCESCHELYHLPDAYPRKDTKIVEYNRLGRFLIFLHKILFTKKHD